jgi:hypothetical protein
MQHVKLNLLLTTTTIFTYKQIQAPPPANHNMNTQTPGTTVVWRPGRETLKIAQDGRILGGPKIQVS